MFKLIYSINMHTFVYQFEQSVIDHYERISLYTKSFCTEIRLCVYHFLWPPNAKGIYIWRAYGCPYRRRHTFRVAKMVSSKSQNLVFIMSTKLYYVLQIVSPLLKSELCCFLLIKLILLFLFSPFITWLHCSSWSLCTHFSRRRQLAPN